MVLNPYIIAAAGRAWAEEKRTGEDQNRATDWIGIHASFDERMLFEWTYLSYRCDGAHAEYADRRARELCAWMDGCVPQHKRVSQVRLSNDT
jgi:hypothetical protein